MNSEEFFDKEDPYGRYFKGVQGIYVVEQPLFKVGKKKIYKVGFARDSLYKRLRDYKTAYGPIPFLIHALIEIPEKVVHQRANFARLTEGRIHKSLKKQLVMKGEDDRQEGEWFYDIRAIISVVKGITKEYRDKNIKGSDWWIHYYNELHDNVRPSRKIASATEITSKLNDLIVLDRSNFSRSVSKSSRDYYESE